MSIEHARGSGKFGAMLQTSVTVMDTSQSGQTQRVHREIPTAL
jgi:hypothetical protein